MLEQVEKWVQIEDVLWREDKPYHPEHPSCWSRSSPPRCPSRAGNVVNPDDVIGEYGADVMRLYEMFMGPLEVV